MPRDTAGNYTLPPENPVFPNDTIETDWANTTMSDLGSAMTDSLSRSGKGGMLVPLKFNDGAIGAPGMTWVNEPTSGIYRAATNDFRWSIFGQDVVKFAPSGIVFPAGKGITGGTFSGMAIDNSVIGGVTPAAGTFTRLIGTSSVGSNYPGNTGANSWWIDNNSGTGNMIRLRALGQDASTLGSFQFQLGKSDNTGTITQLVINSSGLTASGTIFANGSGAGDVNNPQIKIPFNGIIEWLDSVGGVTNNAYLYYTSPNRLIVGVSNAARVQVDANGLAVLTGSLTTPKVQAPASTNLIIDAPGPAAGGILSANGATGCSWSEVGFFPTTDGTKYLGLAANRWTTLYTCAVDLQGNAQPTIRFTPSSGASANASIYQSANTLYFSQTGIGNRISLDIPTGITTFNVNGASKFYVSDAAGGHSGFYLAQNEYLRLTSIGAAPGTAAYGLMLTDNASVGLIMWRRAGGSAELAQMLTIDPRLTEWDIGSGVAGGLTNGIKFMTGNSNTQFAIQNVANAVNHIEVFGNVTGSYPGIIPIGTDTNIGMFHYTKGNGPFNFYTGASSANQQFAILHTANANNFIEVTGSNGGAPSLFTNAGNLGIAPAGGTTTVTGNLTVTGTLTAGSGAVGASSIAFPATQVPSSDPNTLDDYEEGTWTPTLGGTTTYILRNGGYIKIGKKVFVWGGVAVSVIGSGSTSVISGGPFTSEGSVGPGPLAVDNMGSLATAVVSVTCEYDPSATTITFHSRTAANASDAINAIFGTGATLKFGGSFSATA